MINEQDKQKIFNGAYGISRDGAKCKFIGKLDTSDPYKYFFVYFNKVGITHYESLNEDFLKNSSSESPLDVVGLWENRQEPFNLEKALAGEPVMLRNGSKAFILIQIKDTLIGYFDDCTPFGWELNGDADRAADSNHDIVSMWRNPEPNTVTLTLPCPLKEPKDMMWFINKSGIFPSNYDKNIPEYAFYSRPYFGSEQDAKAWWEAMMNSRGI